MCMCITTDFCVCLHSQTDRLFALSRLKQSGAYLTTTEAVLLQLVQDAKHPNFKEVLTAYYSGFCAALKNHICLFRRVMNVGLTVRGKGKHVWRFLSLLSKTQINFRSAAADSRLKPKVHCSQPLLLTLLTSYR